MNNSISANQLLRPDDREEESIDSERMEEFAKLNKAGKLAVINGIFQNLSNLANALDETRPDVSMAIDAIKSGSHMNLKKMSTRYLNAFFDDDVYQYDSTTGEFVVLETKTGTVMNAYNHYRGYTKAHVTRSPSGKYHVTDLWSVDEMLEYEKKQNME